MEPEKRQALLVDLSAPNGLRLSVGRCIGSSDYSRYAYSCEDSTDPDPELIRFSIDHDREYILLTLGAVLKLNPEMFLFGCPWSPAAWMKVNGSMLGGSMRRHYFPSYPEYFVKFLLG